MKPFFPGRLNLQLICGDFAELLSRLHHEGIAVFDCTQIDELTTHCQICRKDYKRFCEIVLRMGSEVTVTGETGLYQLTKKIISRWILGVGILALSFATVFMPSRILFVKVDGNSVLQSERIIEAAESCGIYFGALRKDIRSEEVKNALIAAIPELQWVGVNTAGCVAEISVKEKVLPIEQEKQTGISSIVSVSDGIIRELTVTKGSALCKVGQVVKQGQVMISGYYDCGRVLVGTRAQGEVFGETRRKQDAVIPILYQTRGVKVKESRKFSLKIGKKLINFDNHSGISHTGCVKIYAQEYLTLPGGFQLPVALVIETQIDYVLEDSCITREQDLNWLAEDVKDYLLRQIVAGKFLSTDEQWNFDNGLCIMEGNYACYEMLGRIQNEESVYKNGSND